MEAANLLDILKGDHDQGLGQVITVFENLQNGNIIELKHRVFALSFWSPEARDEESGGEGLSDSGYGI